MGSTAKGVANGLATLGADGVVPDAQLPASLDFDQAAAVADVAALTATAAAGAAPDDDEFDALLADVTAIRTTVNALLASLRTAGLLDT